MEIAKAQANSGQLGDAAILFEEVLRAAATVNDDKDLAISNVNRGLLWRLAWAQGEVGETEAALAWIELVTSEEHKLAALVGLAQGVVARSSSEATKPQSGRTLQGRIVLFGCVRYANPGVPLIQAMRPDGTGLETIVELNKGESIIHGRVSPNGQKLAFSLGREQSTAVELYMMDLGGMPRKIAEEAFVVGWSPDGGRLVCYRGESPGLKNFTLDVVTGKEQSLPIPASDVVTDWSPNGEYLAVTAGNPDKSFEHPTKGTYPLRSLYLIKADGSCRVDLTADPLLDDLGTRVSPTGDRIASQRRQHEAGRVLYSGVDIGLADRAASEFIQINSLGIDNQDCKSQSLCWSPDGKQVLTLVTKQGAQGTYEFELVFASSQKGIERRIELEVEWVTAIDWR